MRWIPPRSPYNLLQESVWQDPWKIFVCCIFCNLTRRVQAEPYFWKTIKKWPNASSLANADQSELQKLIQPLGLSEKRSKTLIRMSKDYIEKSWQEDPKKLYGIGKYGSDAYKIFCEGSWKDVTPKDGALVNYHNYLKELDNA